MRYNITRVRPEVYSIAYYDWCGGWVLYIGDLPNIDKPIYNTKEEAERAAYEHYNNSLEK
jgi:hypothetical protein